jgi:hypothetical protein
MPLRLVLSDFHLDAALAECAEQLPPLPALSRLLHLGIRQSAAMDWRRALAGLMGAPDVAHLAPAVVAAQALPQIDTRRGVWFATPVHQVAGMTRVRLHAAGLLRLTPDECACLCDTFVRDFEGTGLRLHALGSSLLLEGLNVPGCAMADPAQLLGLELDPAQGTIPQALRRLGAELEMWVHEHEVNQSLLRRGQLSLTGLWLWGGDVATPVAARKPSALSAVVGTDPYLSGLAAMQSIHVRPAVAGFAQLPEVDALVLVSTAAQSQGDSPLQNLESQWFEPALAALQQRSLPELVLHLGTGSWKIRSTSLRRFWRRSLPWWQRLR